MCALCLASRDTDVNLSPQCVLLLRLGLFLNEVLKRQRAHMEAARVLSFTEARVAETLGAVLILSLKLPIVCFSCSFLLYSLLVFTSVILCHTTLPIEAVKEREDYFGKGLSSLSRNAVHGSMFSLLRLGKTLKVLA